MKYILFLLSAVISVHGFRTRIFKGLDAPDGTFKHHVLITCERGNRHYCGGSIIDKRWILTAAHCFKGERIRKMLIQVGSVKRSGRDGTYYRAEKFLPHENFDAYTMANDIALLRVDRDIIFNDKVQPIVLADRHTAIDNGGKGIFTGFGRLQDHSQAEILQYSFLTLFDYRTCNELDQRITETQICTLPIDGEGPCAGDSGGPLINENGIQIGVDSGSYGIYLVTCGKIPEIFSRVSYYRDWIDETMRRH